MVALIGVFGEGEGSWLVLLSVEAAEIQEPGLGGKRGDWGWDGWVVRRKNTN